MIRRHQTPTERDLTRLADGSLPAGRRARVERAVAASPELHADLAAQRRALTAIAAARTPAPGALRAQLAPTRAPRHTPRRSARVFATTALAAAAAAVGALLVLGTGTTGAPSVADAAVLGTRPPLAPVPAHHGDSVILARLRASELPYPYWEDRFGFKATGVRRDRLDGRLATTVFYSRAGRRIAYTIVSGAPLPIGSATRSTTEAGIRLRSFTAHGLTVVTWLRRGHTCVLSAAGTGLGVLLRLASWRGGGELPY